MTVEELLTGVKKPLSNQEFIRWMVFNRRREERQNNAQKNSQNKSEGSPKPTLGG